MVCYPLNIWFSSTGCSFQAFPNKCTSHAYGILVNQCAYYLNLPEMSTDASTIYTTGYVMSNNSVGTPPMQYVSTSSSTSATGKHRIIVLLMVFIRLIDN